MTEKAPDVVCTTNPTPGSVVQVYVCKKHVVRYEFKIGSKPELILPYVVAIDGKVLPEHTGKPRHCKCGSGKIKVVASPGETVSLYLNSDAHPAFRREPVYKVKVEDCDIDIKVTEKAGKCNDSDNPIPGAAITGKDGKVVKPYAAPLTGDIWMKVTHRFTEQEANSLIPSTTSGEIKDAVLSIYRGLRSNFLNVTLSKTESNPACKLRVEFYLSTNAVNNITHYSQLTDGLPRVHPLAYVSLLEAAHATGTEKLVVNSDWRPLLGAIRHRAGLGLDVNYLQCNETKVSINRKELSQAKAGGNVTERERELYKQYLVADGDSKRAAADAQTAVNARKNCRDLSRIAEYEKAANLAMQSADEKRKAHNQAEKDWNLERNRNEPVSMRAFRERLARSEGVEQILDPWYVDMNTRDKILAEPNKQLTGDERLHDNHLHISVYEPNIL